MVCVQLRLSTLLVYIWKWSWVLKCVCAAGLRILRPGALVCYVRSAFPSSSRPHVLPVTADPCWGGARGEKVVVLVADW